MTLQTRILLSLLGGILGIYVLSQIAQHLSVTNRIDRHTREAITQAEATDWQWVEKILHSNQAALFEAMNSGDMALFSRLVESQRKLEGVRAISLYNRNGVVTFSSDPGELKKSLPSDLQTALLASAEPVKRRSPVAYEYYRPVAVTSACYECHADFRNRPIGGVLELRYSTESLVAAKAQWTSFAGEIGRSMVTYSAATTAILTVAIVGLISVLVRRQIARPLHAITGAIHGGADDVHAAAAEIARASRQLADGASSQASALEETSASLEEISGMTRSTADHAREATAAANQARVSADAGALQVGAMQAAMSAIHTASEDITNILRTIDEIAFQTNILALNAAVEAARAGEAGLSFAVVANEVRALSQRCAEAAEETAVKTEHSLGKSLEGTRLAADVAATFSTIQQQIRQVDVLVAEIATGCHEQSQGIGQMSGAVLQIDRVTQANAASADETAAATRQLAAEAASLHQAVASLQTLVHGTCDGAAPADPAFDAAAPPAEPAFEAAAPRSKLEPKPRRLPVPRASFPSVHLEPVGPVRHVASLSNSDPFHSKQRAV